MANRRFLETIAASVSARPDLEGVCLVSGTCGLLNLAHHPLI
jgi:hypothetical protein